MSHHPRRRRRRRHFSPLWLPAILAAAAFLYWSNTALQVTEFHPAFAGLPAGFDGCRIALVSDLHGAEFGEDNERLFAALAAEQPEYILYLGDLEDRFRGREEGYAATVAETAPAKLMRSPAGSAASSACATGIAGSSSAADSARAASFFQMYFMMLT